MKDLDFPFLRDLFDPDHCLPCFTGSLPWHQMNIYEHKCGIVLFSLTRLRQAGLAKAFYWNAGEL